MPFAAAVAALDACEIPVDGAGLAVAVRSHDRYTAHLVAALSEFDAVREWDLLGFTSPTAWLRELGMTHRDASELVKLAAKLRRWPVTLKAWIDGRLTGGQVRVIAEIVIERHVALFADHEPVLVPSFEGMSVDDTIMAMRTWRDRADALNAGGPPADDSSKGFLSRTLDGRAHLNVSLDAEGYELAEAALRVATSNDLDTPAPLRRGQAIVDIFRFFLDHNRTGSRQRQYPHVQLMVNAETLGTDHVEAVFPLTWNVVPQHVIQRYLCECELHRVMTAKGAVLDYGRAERTPPPELFAALVARDRKCRPPRRDAPKRLGCRSPRQRRLRSDRAERRALDHARPGGSASARSEDRRASTRVAASNAGSLQMGRSEIGRARLGARTRARPRQRRRLRQ